MTKQTPTKFSTEARQRLVGIVHNEREHPSRWVAIVSASDEIWCIGQTLNGCVNKAERERDGVSWRPS